MVRTLDPFWEYVEDMNDGCTKCKFCKHKYGIGTSVSRVKYHLSGLRRAGVKICAKVPEDVRKAARTVVDGPPRKKLKTSAISSNNEADNITIPPSLTGQNSEAENGMTDRSSETALEWLMTRQKHLDSLIAQATELRKGNSQTLTNINIRTQHYLNLEADNSILRAQVGELSNRLESLNEILNYFNTTSADCFMNPFNSIYLNQPIMASPDLFQY